jgi:hypothetical protein
VGLKQRQEMPPAPFGSPESDHDWRFRRTIHGSAASSSVTDAGSGTTFIRKFGPTRGVTETVVGCTSSLVLRLRPSMNVMAGLKSAVKKA